MRFILSFVVLLFLLPIKAQVKEIKGKVNVGYVSVSILQDVKIIGEKITNEEGSFNFFVNEGNYNLVIESLGLGYDKYVKNFSYSELPLDLGDIYLKKSEGQIIENVTILGEKDQQKNHIDKKVVVVDNSLMASSQDLSSVMNTITGVYINSENQISLRGSTDAKILINGKPTTLSFGQIVKLYPVNLIEKIEVLNNPSSKYSSEGRTGLINIVLKKEAKKGSAFNIYTAYIQGKNPKYYTSVDFNLGFQKFNFFGSAGYEDEKWDNSGSIFRQSIQTLQKHKNLTWAVRRYIKTGADYFLNKKHTFSFYTYQLGDNSGRLSNIDINGIKTFQKQEYNFERQEYDIFYKYEPNEQNKLEFQANYSREDERIERNLETDIKFERQSEDNYRANLDYVLKKESNVEISLGAEARINKYRDKYNFIDYYKFARDIYSIYYNLSKECGGFSLRAGVRGEYVSTKNSMVQGYKNNSEKWELYPNLEAVYALEGTNTKLMFNYSRRINRPWAAIFSPTTKLAIGSLQVEGNKDIKSEITNSVELGIATKLPKLYIGVNIFYRNIKNEISRKYIEHPRYLAQITSNIDEKNSFGGELDVNYTPFKWWKIIAGFEGYFNHISGTLDRKIHKRNTEEYYSRITNSFSLSGGLSFQLFFIYRSKYKTLQSNVKEEYKLDFSMRKIFMDGSLVMTVGISDLFNSYYSKFSIIDPAFNIRIDGESRKLFFSVKYSFLKGKVQKAQRKKFKEDIDKGSSLL